MSRRCVVIGSGLGGLSTGVILARNGWQVTVVEKEPRIGGCLQCFTRRGARFETGMHFIGSARPHELVGKLLRYLGIGDTPLSPLDPLAYNTVQLCGERFRFANGREPFIETLAERFPKEKDNLARYFDIVEGVAASSSLHALRTVQTLSDFATHYQTVSINEVVDSLFADPLLRNVIVGDLPLHAGERDRTPFAQHAFITDFYNRSAFRIPGGSDIIAASLASTLQSLGGEVRTLAEATAILCSDTVATGVEVNGEELLEADLVIGAVHPSIVTRITRSPRLRAAYRDRIATLPATVGCFSLYLKFKPAAVPYMNSNFFSYSGSTPWDGERYTAASWPEGYLYMHHCHEPQPRFAHSAVVLAYMRFSEVAPWLGTRVGERGEAYAQLKAARTARLLEALERDFPGIGACIESTCTATPLTYLDYTGTPGGAMYGVARDITLGAAGRVSPRTRVPNLLLTGQNVNSHGLLGVLVGSILTCSELLGAETIYTQITEANKQ